jgi:acetyl-CoA carboxylase biotin carboxyl carrier protein
MDLQQIQTVIDLMKENGLASFEIQEKDFKLALSRTHKCGHHPPFPYPPFPPAVPQPAPAPVAAPAAPAAPAPAADPNLVEIKSPLIGTFFRAASPDAEPYVSVGSAVTRQTVVGIVEAMKVMNEIKAEVDGTVEKVLVDNATAIQYGQPLFLVRKA